MRRAVGSIRVRPGALLSRLPGPSRRPADSSRTPRPGRPRTSRALPARYGGSGRQAGPAVAVGSGASGTGAPRGHLRGLPAFRGRRRRSRRTLDGTAVVPAAPECRGRSAAGGRRSASRVCTARAGTVWPAAFRSAAAAGSRFAIRPRSAVRLRSATGTGSAGRGSPVAGRRAARPAVGPPASSGLRSAGPELEAPARGLTRLEDRDSRTTAPRTAGAARPNRRTEHRRRLARTSTPIGLCGRGVVTLVDALIRPSPGSTRKNRAAPIRRRLPVKPGGRGPSQPPDRTESPSGP